MVWFINTVGSTVYRSNLAPFQCTSNPFTFLNKIFRNAVSVNATTVEFFFRFIWNCSPSVPVFVCVWGFLSLCDTSNCVEELSAKGNKQTYVNVFWWCFLHIVTRNILICINNCKSKMQTYQCFFSRSKQCSGTYATWIISTCKRGRRNNTYIRWDRIKHVHCTFIILYLFIQSMNMFWGTYSVLGMHTWVLLFPSQISLQSCRMIEDSTVKTNQDISQIHAPLWYARGIL